MCVLNGILKSLLAQKTSSHRSFAPGETGTILKILVILHWLSELSWPS
jgi:hypothetical protein